MNKWRWLAAFYMLMFAACVWCVVVDFSDGRTGWAWFMVVATALNAFNVAAFWCLGKPDDVFVLETVAGKSPVVVREGICKKGGVNRPPKVALPKPPAPKPSGR